MKDSGFTLIELLVVIAIIGLLSSVVLASLNSARVKSRETQRVANLKELQKAVEFYFDDFGNYPNTGGSWSGSCSNPTGYISGIVPNYISVLPLDPKNCKVMSNGSTGVLEYRSDGVNYKILTHNESIDLKLRGLFDPARDGGTDCSVIDGSSPNHMGVWQPESACW